MNWRWQLFWLKDRLFGGKIAKNYKELSNDYTSLNIDRQKEKLDFLLKYAIENTKFYNRYGINIKEFPVINKQIIKDNIDDIFIKKYDKEKLHKMSTSGSTGTPFTVYQNSEKRNAVLAEVLFFGKKANYEFGEKEVYTRVWVKSIKKSKLRKFIQNLETFDISNQNDDTMMQLYKEIISKKIRCMLSYASTLKCFNDFLSEKELNLTKSKLKTILSGSELLNEDVRKDLSKKFNCKVYSRYSNEENGLLGQDNGIEKTFWLNETNYYWEFLKLDSDEPAQQGEVSRIVITDLLNFAMPMIRYDTGDLCKFEIKDNKKYITEIYGRRIDLIQNTKGENLSPHIITNHMWNTENIIQWKFIQLEEKKYKIILNVCDNFNGKEKIIKKFKELLGEDSTIEVEYVKEIPVLNSGKRKYIENLYKGAK